MSQTQNQLAPSASSATPPRHDMQTSGAQGSQHAVVVHRARRLPVLWTAGPFPLMRQFSMEFDRLFNEAMTYGPPTPPIEVLERDGQLLVRADLPGMTRENINIEPAEDGLVISGERREDHEETRQGVQISERRYGRFSRHVALPKGVDAEKAKATFQNGVLEIAIPLPSGPQPSRRIEIQDAAIPSTGEKAVSGT